MLNFASVAPKGTSLPGTASFYVFASKFVGASWLYLISWTTQKLPSKQFGARKTPYPIWIKFCRLVGIPDVITCANFGLDRLRGLGVAGGQNVPFSIDFDRRPYNTLALPCECVMSRYNADGWLQAGTTSCQCCLSVAVSNNRNPRNLLHWMLSYQLRAWPPWPEKARRMGVAIGYANIQSKYWTTCELIKWATKCAKYGDETEI